jgi:hypothetical protein
MFCSSRSWDCAICRPVPCSRSPFTRAFYGDMRVFELPFCAFQRSRTSNLRHSEKFASLLFHVSCGSRLHTERSAIGKPSPLRVA